MRKSSKRFVTYKSSTHCNSGCCFFIDPYRSRPRVRPDSGRASPHHKTGNRRRSCSSQSRNPPKYGRRYSCAGRSDRSHRPVYRARAHPAAPAVHPPGYCGSPRYVTAGIPAACAHPAGQRPKPLEIPARPVLAHMIDDPRQKSIRSGIFFHLMQKSLVLAKRWRCADCKGEPGTSFCGIHPEHLWSLDTGNAPRQCRAHGKADPDNRDFQKCVIVVRIVVKESNNLNIISFSLR